MKDDSVFEVRGDRSIGLRLFQTALSLNCAFDKFLFVCLCVRNIHKEGTAGDMLIFL